MVVGSNPKRGFEERVGGVWKLRFGIVKDSKSKKLHWANVRYGRRRVCLRRREMEKKDG